MLRGKNIIITGCLQGIGNETMRVFSEEGANVFACAIRKTEEFESECAELSKRNGVMIEPIYFDMSDNEAIKIAIKNIQGYKMEINGLVNIAGINRDASFSMISYKDMIDTFQVNFFSQIILSQYVVRLIQKQKTGGSIIFTSSVTATDGNYGQTIYGASKAAINGAVKTMALELGESNIRVNAVAPGVISSPMTEVLSQDIKDRKIRTIDMGRLGKTTEVANLYAFLVSDLSKHITGQVIRVDGGIRS